MLSTTSLVQRLKQKIDAIPVPDLVVEGDADDAELLIVGFGGTYGHLHAAMDEMRATGKKVALAHFKYINPLPKNTAEVLRKYPKVVVAEQNSGQLAAWLRMKVDGFSPCQYNEVKGQPFDVVAETIKKTAYRVDFTKCSPNDNPYCHVDYITTHSKFFKFF